MYESIYLLINSICQGENVGFLGDGDSRVLQRAVVPVNTGLVVLQGQKKLLVPRVAVTAAIFVLTLSKVCRSRDKSLILSMSSPFLFRSSITLCGGHVDRHSSVSVTAVVCSSVGGRAHLLRVLFLSDLSEVIVAVDLVRREFVQERLHGLVGALVHLVLGAGLLQQFLSERVGSYL